MACILVVDPCDIRYFFHQNRDLFKFIKEQHAELSGRQAGNGWRMLELALVGVGLVGIWLVW